MMVRLLLHMVISDDERVNKHNGCHFVAKRRNNGKHPVCFAGRRRNQEGSLRAVAFTRFYDARAWNIASRSLVDSNETQIPSDNLGRGSGKAGERQWKGGGDVGRGGRMASALELTMSKMGNMGEKGMHGVK